MAQLSDVPKAIAAVGFVPLVRRVWEEVNKDSLFTWAAALAYSWLFAIFPFFIFLLALVPYLPEYTKARAKHEIQGLVNELPRKAADVLWRNIDENLDNLLHQPKGHLLYIGLAVALWAASGGMSMTIAALDRCYELERGRPFYRHRLVALLMTIAVAALLLMVVCLLPIGSLIKTWVVHRGLFRADSPEMIAFDIARWVLSVVLMVSVLALIYYTGPNVRHRFHILTPGTVFCVVVWILLGLLFRFYVDRIGMRGYDKTYGTVGGVVVLLFFFYLDALVLLIGAEINSEIDFEVLKVRRGTRDFRAAEDCAANPAPTSI